MRQINATFQGIFLCAPSHLTAIPLPTFYLNNCQVIHFLSNFRANSIFMDLFAEFFQFSKKSCQRLQRQIVFIRSLILIICILCLFSCSTTKNGLVTLSAPAGNRITKIDPTGKTVIPNGRFLTPYGSSITVAPHPFGLALSPDGTVAVTANSGTSPISISIIKNFRTGNPTVFQVPPGPSTDKGILASVFMGLAIPPDNKIVYVAGGQQNKIYIFSIDSGAKLD